VLVERGASVHPARMGDRDARDERPHVLIVGGLLTPPMGYRRMRRRLLDRGAARVDIAPVSVLDWAWAGLNGFGALQRKVARAIGRTRAGSGRPIIVVGHSGGGLLARLAMSDTPYRGQVGGAASMVGCLVTLGSPHDLHRAPLERAHEGVRLAAFLARWQPGAEHQPPTGYVTVASDAVSPLPTGRPVRRGGPLARLQGAFFRRVTGPTLASGSDGMVSLSLAHLPGARQVTLHGTYHGVLGSPWYGDADAIDQWWPHALEAWVEATTRSPDAARQGDAEEAGTSD
jgi:hypothetical protein